MRTISRRSALAALSIMVLCLTGCATPPAKRGPVGTEPAVNPAIEIDAAMFAGQWQAYADEIISVPRQPDCIPRLLEAAPDTPRRGAVLMIHGFGGCPQQFLELGNILADRGFDVVLPLLPGHGLVPTGDGEDDLSRVPTSKDAENPYAMFARRMNDIMARSPGTRIIVGFSLGGAVSLHANLQAPALYDRQLLLSPMLAIRGGAFVEGLAEILGRAPGTGNFIVKPAAKREECYAWQSAGRAGFCDYQYKHVIALLELEEMNRDMLEQSRLKAPLQIVAAGDEDYVSNEQIVIFAERQAERGPISLCVMPADVPHEMLSKYENADSVMYWLEDLLRFSTAFIVEGDFFSATNLPDVTSIEAPGCRIGATGPQSPAV